MNLSQKVAFNTFIQILGRVITAGTTLIVTMITLRHFGVEDLGRLTAVLTYIAYFYLVADFGFNAIVVREAAKDKSRAPHYFSSLLSLRFLASLGLIFLSLLILLILPPPYNQPFIRLGVLFCTLIIPAQTILTSTNAIFQFDLRYDKSTVALVLGSATTLLLVGLFLKLGFLLFSFIAAITFGTLVMAAAALILAKNHLPQLSFLIDPETFKRLFFLTLPLGLTLILNLFYFKIDKFLIPVLRSLHELGLYETAYKVFDLSLVFPVFFMNAVYPVMAKIHNKVIRQQAFKKAFLVLLFTSFLSLAFGLPAAPLIIRLIAGQDLPLSTLVLRILFCSLPIFFLSALLMWDLILWEQQKTLVLIYGIGLIVNLTLNLIFIPQFGILAAAVITGITEAVVLILLFWRRHATLRR